MLTKLVKYSIGWGVLFTFLLIVGSLFYLLNDYQVDNLMKIQFSNNWNDLQAMLAPYKIETLKNHVFLDWFFIAVYTLLFLISIKILALSIGKSLPWFLYVACFFPGIADVIENYQFLIFVNDLNSEHDISWFFWAVRLKWGLLILFILINITITFYYGLYLFIGLIDRIQQFFRFILKKI
ncbi:hypothetical protein BXY75_1253 [Ulvibacter antarcticus]|uniref:Uncharacterized protein n=1 Tax=Ulvibacter antarcticus TaxID=442714 RepID=A0A3L9Z1Z4_9FLAO|nr:hypothetical protein BXY75_1253 [Ulvibacter antarcticus]